MRAARMALAVFLALVALVAVSRGDLIGTLLIGLVAFMLWPKKKRVAHG